MFYSIVRVELKAERQENSITLTPVSVTVEIQKQDTDTVETHVVELGNGEWRQFENLLRHRVDKKLNGE